MIRHEGILFNISLKILFYKENGSHVAHALEMDLKGYGTGREEAFKELRDLIQMQITFAVHKKDLSLVYFPADPKFFRIYDRIREQHFKNLKQDKRFSINDLPLNRLNLSRQEYHARCM